VTFLGFFNPLISGPIVVKQVLKSSVVINGYFISETLI
jgi:hypothetical protein